MKCKECKTDEAIIHVENIGDFCLNCHNEKMADMLGVNRKTDFPKMISVNDADGELHQFEISNRIMPDISIWNADEVVGAYQFDVFAKPEENQTLAILELHQKIMTGLGYKTLHRIPDGHFVSNAIHIDKKQYGLNSVGTCRIQPDEEGDGAYLVIDGKNILLNDFGRALTAFEGFNLDFQIRDLSEEILGKDMVLRPVGINAGVVLDHFEKTLGWFLENDSLSWKRVSACEEALFERIEELEMLFNYGSRDEAVKVGAIMKNRLISIDNDADDFPNYLLDLIDRIIS